MSVVNPKVDKKSKEYQTQLEDAILRYQKALETNNQRAIDLYYNKICAIYPPNLHIQEWYNQYYYLYDSYDDFSIEYMKIFCNVLSNWQPRNLRKVSRYGGSGEFKNYFIGALHHNYINLVKADNAAKRNPSCKCPICDKFVSPLSTHLRKCHSDILWNHINNSGFDLETLAHCPFCKSFKTPRTIECTCETVKDDCEICKKNALKEAIKKHLLSKHSTLLFQKFNEMYPGYQTVSPRLMSVYNQDDNEGDENCTYDRIEDSNKINDLVNMNLSLIEEKIISNALSGKKKIVFSASVYRCTIDEFNTALNSLKNKMSLLGLEV